MENDIAHASATYPERSLYYRDEVKDAVNEALEQAAKVAQNWGAESIAQNDPQDQHEKDIVFAQTLSALVISKGIRALKQE